MRDRLLNRLAFTVSLLVALGIATAVIVAVVAAAGGEPAHRLVVRPAATSSPAP